MKNYYVYEEPNKSNLNIPQDDLQKLACEIVNATSHFGELNDDLIAMEAETTNVSFYILNNISLHSIELTQDGIDLWGDYGRTIHSYLLGSTDNQAELWNAFNRFENMLNEFESICDETGIFEDIGVNLSVAMESHFDEYMSRDQYEFTQTIEGYYKIKKM